MIRRKGSFIALACLLFFAGTGNALARPVVDEARVKVGYIYNFMKFVSWPPLAVNESLNFCILGTNPFGRSALSLNGKEIMQTRVRVFSNVSMDQARHCHVVYVGMSEAPRLSSVMLRLSQRSILTISDIEGFTDKGGIIQFLASPQGEISFRVNNRSAEDAGLRISSKLLSLSR